MAHRACIRKLRGGKNEKKGEKSKQEDIIESCQKSHKLFLPKKVESIRLITKKTV